MPFWGQESEAEKLARQKQAASLKALEMGNIPTQARERLEIQKRQGANFFTSDLSCQEYLLTREAGYQPIGLVMGTAFYKVSFWGYFRNYRTFTGELTSLTQAQLAARELAVSRMRQEAAILGASGVIGVRLKTRNFDWSSRTIEFTAVGTAIRVPSRTPDPQPFTSDLSGQEFWQLHQAGYWPKGLVFGICSYYIHTDNNTRAIVNPGLFGLLSGNWLMNQELTQYTQGFQLARHLAMSRLTADVQKLGASGAVGMDIDTDVEDIEYEINNRTYHDLLAHFIAIGTAILEDEPPKQKSARSPLLIYNLKSGKSENIKINM